MTCYDDVLSRLDPVREHGNRAMARCPAHEDGTMSLSIRYADDKVLLHCFAGCEMPDIMAAAGLEWGDLFDKTDDQWRPREKIERARVHPTIPDIAHLVDRLATEEELAHDPGALRIRAFEFAHVGTPECDTISLALRNAADLWSVD